MSSTNTSPSPSPPSSPRPDTPLTDEKDVPPQVLPPFDRPSADLILRSSDGAEFRVWKCILAEASPVFENMFSLAARGTLGEKAEDRPSTTPSESNAIATPALDVPETSEVLNSLLRICYPTFEHVISSLDELKPVIHAAHKYQMEAALDSLEDDLLEFVKNEPLRVYAIATRYDMPCAVHRAVTQSLTRPWNPSHDHVPEIEDITGGAYLCLLTYRKECTDALLQMCAGLEWLDNVAWTFLRCKTSCTREDTLRKLRVRDGNKDEEPVTWFWEYYTRMAALLRECPAAATISDPWLIKDAVRSASACSECRLLAHTHLLAFMRCMGAEITRRLDKCTWR
ncbi:hypothetical protein OH77DRAFT_1428687 [Trametes cingulata]|nr:hypothetical protein OH77DRAFT_1428687 [Trametes cingulata]